MDPLLIGLVAISAVALTTLVFFFRLARDNKLLAESQRSMIAELAQANAQAQSAQDQAQHARTELEQAKAHLDQLHAQSTQLQNRVTQTAAELDTARQLYAQETEALRNAHADKEHLLNQRLAELSKQTQTTFENLAGKTLKSASDEFLKRAEQTFKAQHDKSTTELEQRKKSFDELLKPITQTLGQTQERLLKLDERIASSATASDGLRDETRRLALALSRPEVRGSYGEIQLRRVAELAGLTNYCDFDEQHSTRDADHKLLRPDMIVRLPNERQIVVDAKCNIDPYLQATRSNDPDEQQRHLEHFASNVAKQAKALGAKRYWSQYDGSPEFVVMFIPGDHFIDAALSRQPKLLELAAESGVILASPSTLIGLLRAVHVGWREHRLAEEAHAMLQAGRELHRRAAIAFEHVNALGKSLDGAVSHFNKFVGSTDRMLMPQLRKFEKMEMHSAKKLAAAQPIEQTARDLEAEVVVKEAVVKAKPLPHTTAKGKAKSDTK